MWRYFVVGLLGITFGFMLDNQTQTTASCKIDHPVVGPSGFSLQRAEDLEHGVVCYRFQFEDGISCLRIDPPGKVVP